MNINSLTTVMYFHFIINDSLSSHNHLRVNRVAHPEVKQEVYRYSHAYGNIRVILRPVL